VDVESDFFFEYFSVTLFSLKDRNKVGMGSGMILAEEELTIYPQIRLEIYIYIYIYSR